MKRFLAVILLLCLFSSVALADIFSDFTYDELLTLHHALDQEIMKRPEWKEVTVPAGDWIVGVDIPGGTYSIRPAKYGYINVTDENGSLFYNKAMDEGEVLGKIELKPNYTVRLNNDFIFSPSIGLGF